jgi:hypothetical protein
VVVEQRKKAGEGEESEKAKARGRSGEEGGEVGKQENEIVS